MDHFKAGDEVYDLDGRAYEYSTQLPDGSHLVRHYIQTGEDEWIASDNRIRALAEVYTEPPTEARHTELRKLSEELDKVREELWHAREELRKIPRQLEQLGAEHAALRRLKPLMDGEITHVVAVEDCTPVVYELAEFMRKRKRQAAATPMLTLRLQRIDSSSRVHWHMPEDWKAKGVDVRFARSAREAQELARDYLRAQFADESIAPFHLRAAAAAADTFRLPIPQDVQAKLDAWETKRLVRELSRCRQNLTRDQERLARVTERLIELGVDPDTVEGE